MTTKFPEIQNATLQLLCDRVFESIRQTNGTVLTTFVDRLGNAVPANSFLAGGVANPSSQAGPGREVIISIRVNPDGNTAFAKIEAVGPYGTQASVGQLDPSIIGTHLT